MEDESIAGGRSKRQKLDKHGRFAALERLKNLKGSKNKCVIDQVANVYDEVDEREYSKRVLSRQEDDWIVDDGGGGYVEDGREIFDDDQNEEAYSESSKKKSKSCKKEVAASSEKSKNAGGNIQSMLANMATKKKVPQTKVNADELLDNLMGEIENEKSSKTPTLSSREYLKSFSNRSTTPCSQNEIKPKPVVLTPRLMTAVKRRKSPSPVPVRRALIADYSKNEEDSLTLDDNSEPSPCGTKEAPKCSPEIVTESAESIDDGFGPSEDFADINMDDFSEPFETATTILPPKNDKEEALEVASSWFDDDWDTVETPNDSCSLEMDSSSVPLVAAEDGEEVFRFFWWDAYEDPYHQPGKVFLFGKAYVEKAKKYVSCCVVVNNIPRKVFFLPRLTKYDMTSKTETSEPVKFVDLFNEFNQKVATSRKIMKHKVRRVVRKYSFELADVPAESEYLEAKYPANYDRLPNDLQGETFCRVFGTNTNALEVFLLERKIKGPCWLDVKKPKKGGSLSWCQLELTCPEPEDVSVSKVTAPPPPLSTVTLNIRTVLNTRTMHNEVIMVSFLTQSKFSVDKPAPSPPYEHALCAFTRPSDVVWPVGLKNEISQFRGKTIQHESERSLLSFLLTKIFQLDPDLIVGHDLYGFTLDTVIHRVEHYKIGNWSRIGRLRRSMMPQKKGKSGDRHLVTGRLVCDTMRSARELIRARSYDLDTLSKQVLKLPDDKRQDFTIEEVKGMYSQSKSVLSLVNATMQDAFCALRLMYELNVLPLALQITNIAGNIMSGTLLGGRSERNEFLLLHAFTEKDFIVPDKVYGKKKINDDGDVVEQSNRKKPEYAGGLVLEPKKGFYDKYILLMDFNSLYPSIIQEYNICFTTVTRTTNAEQEPELPAPGVPLGILPIEIRKLVESRRQVKTLMKAADLSSDLKMQYNIRQTALKLTANSMYGCLGFGFSRFYAKPLAALVTSRGREILMNTRDLVQRMNYDVIYGDTDSIMINSNCVDYEQVISIGNKIKLEINKLYKHVELEVDGVFKYMLLLKKKKYAAVVLSKAPGGQLIASQEYKGLDIVRRDWSRLSAEIGEFVLQQILSDIGPDERVGIIRTHLEKVASDLKSGVVPTALLAITKQLAKNPEDYPDRKSLPHLQVAMRVNSKGGKKLKAGDTVSYVICDDGTNESAVQRAYHVDELKTNDKLLIDVNYYLSSQIHPVVSRLCEPIDGLDAAFIAECLGLDPTSYKRAAARSAVTDAGNEDDDCIVDDIQYFKHCDKFSFTCPNEDCKTTITMESAVHDNYLVLSRCRNPACSTAPTQYIPRLQNCLQLSIRSYMNKLYENWLICEDPACTNRTRRVPMEFANSFPVCRQCGKGLMYREYQNSDLYYQLKFFAHMFNLKPVKMQTTLAVENAYKTLHEQVEQILSRSAYRIIDFSKIFKFALSNSRPNLSASQRALVDVHTKLSSL